MDALTSASGAASLLPVGRATLALGNVKVNCSLLDTGKDASISVSLEDVGLYLSPTPDSGLTVNLVNDAVCVCDVDLLEVTVNLRDNAGCHGPVTDLPEEELDVCISCNLLRLRTCSDTVVVIAELADHLAKVASNANQQQSVASRERSREGSAGPLGGPPGEQDPQAVPDEVLPDLEDAMEELEAAAASASNTSAAAKSASGKMKQGRGKGSSGQNQRGAQVFFFPNEGK